LLSAAEVELLYVLWLLFYSTVFVKWDSTRSVNQSNSISSALETFNIDSYYLNLGHIGATTNLL